MKFSLSSFLPTWFQRSKLAARDDENTNKDAHSMGCTSSKNARNSTRADPLRDVPLLSGGGGGEGTDVRERIQKLAPEIATAVSEGAVDRLNAMHVSIVSAVLENLSILFPKPIALSPAQEPRQRVLSLATAISNAVFQQDIYSLDDSIVSMISMALTQVGKLFTHPIHPKAGQQPKERVRDLATAILNAVSYQELRDSGVDTNMSVLSLSLESIGRLFPKPLTLTAEQQPSDRIHELAHGIASAVSEQGLDSIGNFHLSIMARMLEQVKQILSGTFVLGEGAQNLMNEGLQLSMML